MMLNDDVPTNGGETTKVPGWFALAMLLLGLFAGAILTWVCCTVSSSPASSPGTTGVVEVAYDLQPDLSRTTIDANDYQHVSRVCFTFDRPIAPDFYVGYGTIGSGYEIFLDKSDRYDPLGIGVDTALGLITKLRAEVPGLTEDCYASGYELCITIADSHLDRKFEIIKEALVVFEEFFDGGRPAEQVSPE